LNQFIVSLIRGTLLIINFGDPVTERARIPNPPVSFSIDSQFSARTSNLGLHVLASTLRIERLKILVENFCAPRFIGLGVIATVTY